MMVGMLSDMWSNFTRPQTEADLRRQAAIEALGRGGAAMIKASGPSRMPVSLLSALGANFGATADSLAGARKEAMLRAGQKSNLETQESQRQTAELQRQATQAKLDAFAREQEALGKFRGLLRGPRSAAPSTDYTSEDPAGSQVGAAERASYPGELKLAAAEAYPELLAKQAFAKPVNPLTGIGKLKADLAAGRITPSEYKMGLDILQKPLVTIPPKLTEIQGLTKAHDENADKADAARRAGNITEANKYQSRADRLKMQLMFGGKPPEAYAKAAGAVGLARNGISSVYSLVKGGASSVKPVDRAKLSQAFEQARLGFAELTNRGANFTDTEQAMIASVLGGNPTNVIDRLLRGDKAVLNTLQTAGEIIEQRGQSLLDAYTKPMDPNFTYPWQGKGGKPASRRVPAVGAATPPPGNWTPVP